MKPNTRPRESRAVPSHNGQESATSSPNHVYARVAELAYSFYEQRGRRDGHDVEDWIQAEKTILEGHNSPAAGTESSRSAVSERGAARVKAKRG